MPKKLIEVALPLEAINKEASREKSIRHGHPSTLHLWWARRPLATARAVLFASVVDDPQFARKNTRDNTPAVIYTELVPFDAALAQRMSDRALKVISATDAGELLVRAYQDPTHFECRMCAWQDRCWRQSNDGR